MDLLPALERLARIELRAAEVYLRAALAGQDIKSRQFFIDMSKEELKHARTLLEMAPQAKAAAFEVDLSDQVDGAVEEARKRVASAGNCQQVFSALLLMEGSELNSIYESLLHLYTNYLVPKGLAEVFQHSTERHLEMLRQAADLFGLDDCMRGEMERLRVKRIDYYRDLK